MEKKQNTLKPKGMGRSWNYKLSLKWNKKTKTTYKWAFTRGMKTTDILKSKLVLFEIFHWYTGHILISKKNREFIYIKGIHLNNENCM